MQGVFLTDISDPIFSINWYIEDKCVDTLSWRRNLSEKRINRFKQLIIEYEWLDIYSHFDTNIAFGKFGKFHERLKLAYDKAFPIMQIWKCYNT